MAKRRPTKALQRVTAHLARNSELWDQLVEDVYISHRVQQRAVRAAVDDHGELVLVSASRDALDKVTQAMHDGAAIRAVTITPESPADIARRLRAAEVKK